MKNKRKMIQIATPYMGEEEWQALREPLETGWLTQGPKVAAFEKEFGRYHKVEHALATTSCTTALHLALLAVGVRPGDRVIVPSYTWIASANAVEYCGAVPLFCDIDLQTFNIDVHSAEKEINKALAAGDSVKAILPVHLFGTCADMEEILALASHYNLAVVEDAACAAGASYHGRMAGSWGDVGCFSFHPRKLLVTGEGGMCTTNRASLAEEINSLRNHGATISEENRHYGKSPFIIPDYEQLGFNYRMTDLQGALGLVQLQRLEEFIEERQSRAAFYDRELSEIDWLHTPALMNDRRQTWQSYVCLLSKDAPFSRDQLMSILYGKGISTRFGTQAVHMQGYYRNKYKLRADYLPAARDAYLLSLALPLHNCMDQDDYLYVVETLQGIAG